MTTRNVTGQIKSIEDDEPLPGVSVSFVLDRGTFVLEDNAHYPPGQVTVVTDENGFIRTSDGFGVDLAVNANNALQVKYRCILPNNDRFPFFLASGVGEITVGVLRAASLTPFDEATEVTIQQLVDTALAPLLPEIAAARTASSDGLEKDTLALRLAADFAALANEQVLDVTEEEFTPPALNAILLVDTTDNAVEIVLLEAPQVQGRRYLVKLVAGANAVTFDAIADTVLVSLNESVTVLFDGSNWIVIAQFP